MTAFLIVTLCLFVINIITNCMQLGVNATRGQSIWPSVIGLVLALGMTTWAIVLLATGV